MILKITFLGTGTSQGIPVIACDCEVCRSADKHDTRLRSSVLIETEDTTLVIDTGPDFRYQMLRARVKHLDAVLFTHEHKDHIAGLDDIRAFNYLQGKGMDIYASARVQEALKREFSYAFAEYKYPGIPLLNLHEVKDENFTIGKLTITPVQVLHYKLPVLGYRIGDFTYITDAKTISSEQLEKIRGTRVLVINALQMEPHISHFTLQEAIDLSVEVGAEMTYLTHVSHRMGLEAEVKKTLPVGVAFAYDGLEVVIA